MLKTLIVIREHYKPAFMILDGDYSHLNGVLLDYTDDETLVDEVKTIRNMYWQGKFTHDQSTLDLSTITHIALILHD